MKCQRRILGIRWNDFVTKYPHHHSCSSPFRLWAHLPPAWLRTCTHGSEACRGQQVWRHTTLRLGNSSAGKRVCCCWESANLEGTTNRSRLRAAMTEWVSATSSKYATSVSISFQCVTPTIILFCYTTMIFCRSNVWATKHWLVESSGWEADSVMICCTNPVLPFAFRICFDERLKASHQGLTSFL